MTLTNNKFKGKSIAVIGANGYLGSALVQALCEKECKVISVSSKKLRKIPNTINLIGSIMELDFCNEILKQSEIIYLLSGNTSVNIAEKNPPHNLTTTLSPIKNIIQSARINGKVPRLIFASTATVYGLTSTQSVDEKCSLIPETIYDLHKLFAEQLISYASNKGYIEGTSLRLSNVYGPSLIFNSASDRGIINRAVRAAVKGENLELFGSGKYIRDYIYITDVIESLIRSGYSANVSGEVFNIGTGEGNTVEHVYKLIARITEELAKKKISISYSKWPLGSQVIEQRNFIADIKKFKEITGWTPRVRIHEGIKNLVHEVVTEQSKKLNYQIRDDL